MLTRVREKCRAISPRRSLCLLRRNSKPWIGHGFAAVGNEPWIGHGFAAISSQIPGCNIKPASVSRHSKNATLMEMERIVPPEIEIGTWKQAAAA